MSTRDEIESLTTEFARAVSNRDLDAMGAFYEQDARFLPPGAPMAQGWAGIHAAQKRMIEGGVHALDLEVVDVIEAGDFAIEVGRVTVTIQLPGTPAAMTESGKSVVIWRRQKDGTLKIVVDTFNTDRRP